MCPAPILQVVAGVNVEPTVIERERASLAGVLAHHLNERFRFRDLQVLRIGQVFAIQGHAEAVWVCALVGPIRRDRCVQASRMYTPWETDTAGPGPAGDMGTGSCNNRWRIRG